MLTGSLREEGALQQLPPWSVDQETLIELSREHQCSAWQYRRRFGSPALKINLVHHCLSNDFQRLDFRLRLSNDFALARVDRIVGISQYNPCTIVWQQGHIEWLLRAVGIQ
jgi:hypothetical protein